MAWGAGSGDGMPGGGGVVWIGTWDGGFRTGGGKKSGIRGTEKGRYTKISGMCHRVTRGGRHRKGGCTSDPGDRIAALGVNWGVAYGG